MNKAKRSSAQNTIHEEYLPTLRALAHRVQVSSSSVKNLRRDGLANCSKGYRLSEARQLLNVRAVRARGLASSPDAVALKTQKLSLDVERSRFELELSKGEWIRKVDISREWCRAVIVVRDRFKNLGRELAPRLVSLGPQAIRAEIDRRIYEILRLLAHEEFALTVDTADEPTTNPKENV